jgi:hypothetical protein
MRCESEDECSATRKRGYREERLNAANNAEKKEKWPTITIVLISKQASGTGRSAAHSRKIVRI